MSESKRSKDLRNKDLGETNDNKEKTKEEETEKSSEALSKAFQKLQKELIEEKMRSINKSLQQIEEGTHPELIEATKNLQEQRDRKLAIANERYRLAVEAANQAFDYEVAKIKAEKQAAEKEVMRLHAKKSSYSQSKKRRHSDRIQKPSFHPLSPAGTTVFVSHEFSEHLELQLSKREIDSDLEVMQKNSRPKTISNNGEIEQREIEGSNVIPKDLNGNQYHPRKIRRKSR